MSHGKTARIALGQTDGTQPLEHLAKEMGDTLQRHAATEIDRPLALNCTVQEGFAPHRLRQRAGDRQSQAGAPVSAGDRPVSLLEPPNPLFVRAGSIIPYGPRIEYAMEKSDPIELRVYRGTNGSFTLYEDEGDNYNYEKGLFSRIEMDYSENAKMLTINDRKGEFSGMLKKRVFRIIWISKNKIKSLDFDQPANEEVMYAGKQKIIKMK